MAIMLPVLSNTEIPENLFMNIKCNYDFKLYGNSIAVFMHTYPEYSDAEWDPLLWDRTLLM
ncbi:hypothetical protein SODG_000166 [Sodalis praecaptivus]